MERNERKGVSLKFGVTIQEGSEFFKRIHPMCMYIKGVVQITGVFIPLEKHFK